MNLRPIKKLKSDLNNVIKRGYLNEQNVGITEFIGNHKPFHGILKHRFEDFVVHEIDRQGNVIRLENIDKPEDISLTIADEERQTIESSETISIDSLKIDSNFKQQIDSYVESNFQLVNPLISIDELDKQERSRLHLFIKQNYPTVESNTETIDGKRFVKILAKKQQTNRNQRQQCRRQTWPTNRPSFVHFVLYKENMETIQVVNEFGRRLGVATKTFTYAGNKDKRAISTQKFSAFRMNPAKIWQACQEFNHRSGNRIRLHVGHFHFENQPLRLGDLSGNQFEIVLRDVRLIDDGDLDRQKEPSSPQSQSSISKINELIMDMNDRDLCEQALINIKTNGFINYYGMQRFGSHRNDSHKLGILVLRKEFKKLVEEILVEKPTDRVPYGNRKNSQRNEISFNEAIRLWRQTRDAGEAYRKLNYKYTIEGSLLRGLSKVAPNDYHGGLCIGLNRNSRLLYLHAYQSYLWNRIASYRVRQYGLNVVEGDLVFVGPNLDDETNEADISEQPDDDESDNNQNHNNNIKANIPNDQIELVTKENLEKFSIYDVVIPIIGSLSKFPTNLTKKFIDEILQEDSISLEQFSNLGQQWCVNGSYRKLIVRPSEFEWEWLEYQDDTKPLIQTDLDRIQSINNEIKMMEKKDNNDNYQALKIMIRLPTSSYATICLRELTKISSLSLENKPWITNNNDDNNHDDDDDKKRKNG
ncbi:multisubstrate pseudouridine synthase 7 [Dermatophagoides pteronyssinus]|uniref:Pseudouridylate synthase 7 homolog n=2 Tax=Dermatophagoides pteronyssinus TaxID=6956 RepID=A0A6P6Y8W7_DERPT|nr:pseudouridylate synthase 7 homolog [Dermatophagoides pteronyssinus]KAH9420432.1 multisubstrate pseudouridine synthase 7 [Dermatophagoides pteronyssinus]